MRLRTVLAAMAVVGLGLAAFSFGLHEHVLAADEAQVRHACRRICVLQVDDTVREATENEALGAAFGKLAGAFSGSACEAMDDNTDVLLACRDRLTGDNLKVSAYRCVLRAATLTDAEGCLPR